MSEPTAWFDRIEELLEKLATDSAAKRVNSERVRMRLLDVATALDESRGTAARELAARIRELAQDLSSATLPAVVEETRSRWESVKVSALSEPVMAAVKGATATPALDDELATLASDPEMAQMFVAEALDHLGTIESVI